MKLRMIVAAFVVLAATALVGQTFRGTILGTVTDASGAVVSGATVKVHNVNTGLDRTTQTSADGSYSVPELPIGTYSVTVSQSGFQTSVTTAVAVDVAGERRVDATLKPGQVTEQVEVSGESLPMVETTTNDLGGVLTQETVKDLPINGRDYTKLIFLNPGVAGSPDQITDSPGSFGEFSMNGARGRSNNYLLDGTDMNDGYRNDPAINQAGVFGTPSAILPIDAISDMRVLSNFQPEYGRNGGAIVNIVTKSGANQVHGDFFEYFRNAGLDARNYFNPNGTPKAPFHNNQFGGSLGGPIVKDRTFFFVDYEGQRESVGVVSLACVPTLAHIQSAASGVTVSPVGQAIVNFYPHNPSNYIPGVISNDGGCFNAGGNFAPDYAAIAPSFNNLSSFIAKIDHSFNQTNNVSGRYFFGDSTQQFPLALNASGGQLPGFDTVTPTRVQLVSLSYVRVISPTKVNELRYGWNRFAEGFFPQDRNFNPNSIDFCNTPTTSGTCDSQGLPIILLSPTPTGASGFFAQLGATSGDPRSRVDTNNQVIDSFSWKMNKHDIKFGVEYRRTSIQQQFDKYSRGRIRFNDLGSMLAMAPQQSNFGLFNYGGGTLRHTSQNGFGLYVQDSFRLTPHITLNYGVRWDYLGVIAEKNNLFSDFIPATGTLQRVGGSGGLDGLYNSDKKNFSPRVSIAWDVTGKGRTVVRAGYGLFFDAFSQDMALGHLPYPTFYAPGPAYNPIGPYPVQMANANGAAFDANGAYIPGQHIYGTPGCSVECDIFSFDRNIKTPYIENYNLNFQQQISRSAVLQVGYVGSQGHRLLRFFDLNQPNQATITACDLGQLAACPTPGIYSVGVPRNYGFPYGAAYIFQQNSTGSSNYNSLQSSFRVNNYHGITSVVNYVWSRSMDNSSDGEDFVVNAAQPQDSNRPGLEYGPSNFNLPHRFTWIFSYEFPKMGGGMQRLKNGWGFDSTATLQSGQPFTLNYNFEDDYSGGGDGFDRPDVVGPIVYNKRNPSNYVQLSSFAMPCTVNVTQSTLSGFAGDCVPGTRHYGTLGRNALVGPTYKQWDLAIYKNTAITERVAVQLRADFFNILNHPNFANPVLPAFIADPASNIAQGCVCGFHVNGNREVGNGGYQITATGDVGIGNPFLGGGAPRGIQLAAKFTF